MKIKIWLIMPLVLFSQWSCNSGSAQQEAGLLRNTASGGLLSIQIMTPPTPYAQPQELQRFVEKVLSKIRIMPGVETVAATSSSPENFDMREVQREGFEGKSESYSYKAVTPEYFDVIRLNVLMGRRFTERDRSSNQKLILVSQSVARELFLNEDPIGKRISVHIGSNRGPLFTVVGVVLDARDDNDKARKDIYGLYYQDPTSDCSTTQCLYIIARTNSRAEAVSEKLKDAITAVDNQVTISKIKNLL